MEVRPRPAVLGVAGCGNPVSLLATRIDYLHRRRSPGTMAEPSHLDTANMIQRQVGDVHIEHGARRQVEPIVGSHETTRDVGSGRQVVRLARKQREGERRQGQESSFQGCRHRAGIEHVVTQIGAQVNARYHQIRQLLQQAIEAQVDAIGRRAVEADEAVAQRAGVKRAVQGQGTAGATFVLVRCDDHTVGVILERTMQSGEPGGSHPVVVGNQNAHGFSVCPAGSRSTSSRTTAVAKHPAGRTNSSCRTSDSG
ncbi:hypothetical protein D3C84_323900 [compost metagenome]